MAESDKIMFEIYREAGYGRKFRVVYFTELDEHNKEAEIARALAGEHFFDGFLRNSRARDGKALIDGIIKRLNDGHEIAAADVAEALEGHTAD